MIILAVIGVILTIGFVWLVWQFVHAVEGWQDESGFHYGRRK
jgi:hypothetical protein